MKRALASASSFANATGLDHIANGFREGQSGFQGHLGPTGLWSRDLGPGLRSDHCGKQPVCWPGLTHGQAPVGASFLLFYLLLRFWLCGLLM